MSEDKLAFLDEAPKHVTTEDVSPPAPAPEAAPRDEHGRFAPKDKGETPAAEPVTSAPPAPEPEKAKEVPILALLDEREKRQQAERELAAYRQRLAALERQQAAPQIPDAIEDQQGFAAYLMQQQQAQIDNLEAQFSERMARKDFGSEAVDAALKAAQEAGVVGSFTRGPDRWERMVLWHKEQSALKEIGPDPAAYRARLEAEIRAKLEADYAAQRPAAPSAPPASLASAPSAARSTGGSRGSGFDAAFPG